METCAVIKGPPRALVAAGLLATALAVLLVAWFFAGWSDVRARQLAIRTAPQREAVQRATELAEELRAELASLITRELERPYFHYQNLMRDPRASRGTGVSPSPLAAGPRDPLVVGYFQLDPATGTSTPTINDEVPELSEPTRLAEHRRFRDEVTRSLSATLMPRATPEVLVARASPTPPVPIEPAQQASSQQVSRPQAQVVTIDRNSYVQNSQSNAIYQQHLPAGQLRKLVDVHERASTETHEPPGAMPTDAVTIIVSPFEWRTLPFGGPPSLLAVRQVETPDGALAQGFVVDHVALTSWLATRAGSAVVELREGEASGTAIAPGWHLSVTADARAVAGALAEAATVARGFVLRFVLLGVIAAVAAGLVVLLVVRSERLARERSQFAAAAAHELRTPLAGLQLYGDMLADGLGDPAKQRDYARRMSEEASRLGRVVSNVLGFSQLERGNLSVEPTVGALDLELRRLAERAEPALDRAGAALELDISPELRARFDGDALARIVGNLLDNAEKYGRDAADRTISLSARSAGEAIEVVIADHGPGVAAHARARLFRAFARGVAVDGPAGLGLGLALSRSLARAMGGELDYRPAPGGGAAFVLRLGRA